MVAITGMISQNAFFGTTGPSMWLPGSSAFEGAEGFPSDEGLDAGNSHLTHLIRCLFLVVLVNYFFDSLNWRRVKTWFVFDGLKIFVDSHENMSFFKSDFFWEAKLRAGELGVQAPVGFWDPLGLSADGDALTLHMLSESYSFIFVMQTCEHVP